MTSRDRTLISGLKQLFVVAARVATVNTTVAEVSSGQKQDTTNDNSFHTGTVHEITGAWQQPHDSLGSIKNSLPINWSASQAVKLTSCCIF